MQTTKFGPQPVVLPGITVQNNQLLQSNGALNVVGVKVGNSSNSDTLSTSLFPDLAFIISDASGNIVFAIDLNGTILHSNLTSNTATITTLSIANSLAVPNIISLNANGLSTNGVIQISNDILQVSTTLPDLAWSLADPSGNVVFAVSLDGSINLSVLNSGTINVSTLQVTNTLTLPSNATINVGSLNVSNSVTLPNVVSMNVATLITSNSLTISNDTLNSSQVPDTAWTIADANGNIVFLVGLDGSVTLGNLNSNSVNTGSFATVNLAANVVTGNTVKVGNDTLQTTALPDLAWSVADANGNVVLAVGVDGTVTVNNLSLTGNLSGYTVNTSSVPSDAVDVTLYGAKGDGIENFGYLTISSNTANVLSVVNFSGNISLTQNTSSQALLTIASSKQSGWAFQPQHVGKQVYFSANGYSLQANVTKYIDGSRVLIAAGNVTTQNAISGYLTLPSFNANTDVGKYLIVDSMGQNAWWPPGSGQTADNTMPYGVGYFITTISSVTTPNQITVANNFPYARNNLPGYIVWGSNDGPGAALAANNAWNNNKRKVYFKGDGSIYLLLGLGGCGAGRIQNMSSISSSTDATALLAGVIWEGDNSKAIATDTSGRLFPRQVSPRSSDPSKLTARKIIGRATFRRCSNLSTINLFIVGDSQGNWNPQGQAAAYMKAHQFVEEFKRANPGKTINVYQMSQGGSTWADLADPNYTYNDTSAGDADWTVPRPISGTVPWFNFVMNANQTGTGSPILPDCIALFESGGNDGYTVDPDALRYVLNRIKTINHGDAYGPPDVILQTDYNIIFEPDANGIDPSVQYPDILTSTLGTDYTTTLISSTAYNGGYGHLDITPVVQRACLGIDTQYRAMRYAPQVGNVTISNTSPLQIPFAVRDFSMWLGLNGTNDANSWPLMQELDIQISQNPGNKVMMRYGNNGNLWLGVSTWGAVNQTNVSITSGSANLTINSVNTYSVTLSTGDQTWPQLWILENIFTANMAGLPMVAPTGHKDGSTYQPQRTYIRSVQNGNNVMLTTYSQNGKLVNVAANVSIGGAAFVPADSYSQPDIVIFFPDGTIWNTQVASNGYVSTTQAVLTNTAPQTLTGQTVPVFIGRMGTKWYDTGINLSSQTAIGIFEIAVTRNSLLMGYKANTRAAAAISVDIPVERFGNWFNPIITAANTQSIFITNMFIDTDVPRYSTSTPFEIRGIKDNNNDYYLGGVGGHPASRIRTDVHDPLFATQDLSTY